MEKIRWLNAQWPYSMRTIGNKLKEMPFTDGSTDGFLVERIRDDFVEGRFIEKYAYEEIIADPFGGEDIFDRIGYRLTAFTLRSKFPYIELRNSPRSIKAFINRLLQVCNFNLVVSPITVNLTDWTDSFQKTMDRKILVDSLQISGIVFENGITGKILLKGNKDVREAVNNVVKNKIYSLDKVQIKLSFLEKYISIHLTNNGTARITSRHTSEILNQLRNTLPKPT